jgi:hypothetical protein
VNQNRYAVVTHSLTSIPSRRDVLRGLAGAALGLGVARLPELAEAKKKRKSKGKGKPKAPKPNGYGCLNVGAACANEDQCCSGVCEGKTCRAHHVGICQADYDLCTTGAAHVCSIVGGGGDITCACVLTTGNAPFCGETSAGYDCQECSQDADCEDEHGAGAACVVIGAGICEGLCAETGGLACMKPCANPAR